MKEWKRSAISLHHPVNRHFCGKGTRSLFKRVKYSHKYTQTKEGNINFLHSKYPCYLSRFWRFWNCIAFWSRALALLNNILKALWCIHLRVSCIHSSFTHFTPSIIHFSPLFLHCPLPHTQPDFPLHSPVFWFLLKTDFLFLLHLGNCHSPTMFLYIPHVRDFIVSVPLILASLSMIFQIHLPFT